jgi:hypothetical protein
MIDDQEAIGDLIAECAFELPESYVNFLRQYGSIEGRTEHPALLVSAVGGT